MDLEKITGAFRDAGTVQRVFGDPVESADVTVIPVARVTGGGGAGEGHGGEDEGGGGGSGAGGGFSATPVGVYVIRGGDVTFVPVDDRAALAGRIAAVAIVALVSWRSVARARQRRKAREARAAR